MNEKSNYVLVTLKTTENYDNLEESLADLTEEMSKLNKVKVGGKSSNIKYFLGGDGKFSTCVCGLGGANQEYACIWCKCPHNQRHIKRVWSLSNSFRGGLHHWRKFPNLPNQKSSIARKPFYSISHHLIM